MSKNHLPFHIKVGLPSWLWKRTTLQAFVLAVFVFYKKEDGMGDDLLVHELIHVQQFYKEPFAIAFKYVFSKEHRLRYESEAYAKQLLYILSKTQDITIFTEISATRDYLHYFKQFSSIIHESYNLDCNIIKCEYALTMAVDRAIAEVNENAFYADKPGCFFCTTGTNDYLKPVTSST